MPVKSERIQSYIKGDQDFIEKVLCKRGRQIRRNPVCK